MELLVSMAIMSVIALALATVSVSTNQVADYTTGRGEALQHGRVAWERIQRIVQESYGAEQYPGAAVLYDQLGTYRYPDTLLVWHPSTGTPANVNGPPLVSEVLFYSTNPSKPNELVEYWNPNDATPIPFGSNSLNTSAWRTYVTNLKNNSTTQKVVITNLLRVAQPTGQSASRGAVRFDMMANPSIGELASYRAGSTLWKNLPWPTVSYQTSYGLRQLRVRAEFQFYTGAKPGTIDNIGLEALPYFGSTATMQRLTP